MLYTKYSPSEGISQIQSVRPLGSVRKERRPSSEKSRNRQKDTDGRNKPVCNGSKDMTLNKRPDLEKVSDKFRSEQNISTLELRERENTAFPLLNLSRSQAFENKFKIAAARGNGGQDCSTPKPQKTFDKKVVHLPLFRINLKTYDGDSEVSRTVAKTRESLRKLMELHTSKMKSNCVTTANIRNYEFRAPPSGLLTSRSHDPTSNALLSKPFHAKPALKSCKGQRDGKPTPQPLSRQPTRLSALDIQNSSVLSTTGYQNRETPCYSNRSVFSRLRTETPAVDDTPDDSMLSTAMRPDTSLTLGSTMHHLDRVIKSPGSDELRELSEVLKNTETQQAWPNVEEVHRLSGPLRSHSRNRRSRTSYSRPGTVLNDLVETPDDTYDQCYDSFYGPKPVFRYTSKHSMYKLDPIIVPSHTCTECSMCNIYQRELESPCPPNTPNTSHFMLDGDSPTIKPPFIRGTKLVQRPEVLNISRVHMGAFLDEEECPELKYMNSYVNHS